TGSGSSMFDSAASIVSWLMPRVAASARTSASHSVKDGRVSCADGRAGLRACATATSETLSAPMAQPSSAALMRITTPVYMRSSAAMAFFGIRCRLRQYSFHGSDRNRARRSGTVRIVNRSGVRERDNSVHVSGTEIGASGFARVEYAAIDVFVRLLRK